ncbi:MAG: methyl-accepting chemotaxis protein, partial [Gammaproteobacteria bacterium]|nr:methyl-accepting chemotaxis protein [Gammaproteobacteria bacterium]
MKMLKTIRGRYTLIFGGLALVFLLVIISTETLVNYLQNSMGKYSSGTSLIQNADRDLYQSRLALATLVFEHNANNAKELEEATLSNAKQALDRMQQFRLLTTDIDEISSLLANFDSLYKDWSATNLDIIQSMKDNPDAAIILFVSDNQTNFIKLRSLYDHSEELISKYSALENKAINEFTDTFKLTVGIFAIFALLLSVILAWFA